MLKKIISHLLHCYITFGAVHAIHNNSLGIKSKLHQPNLMVKNPELSMSQFSKSRPQWWSSHSPHELCKTIKLSQLSMRFVPPLKDIKTPNEHTHFGTSSWHQMSSWVKAWRPSSESVARPGGVKGIDLSWVWMAWFSMGVETWMWNWKDWGSKLEKMISIDYDEFLVLQRSFLTHDGSPPSAN